MNDLFDESAKDVGAKPFGAFWLDTPKAGSKHVAMKSYNRLGPSQRKAAHDSVRRYYDWWRVKNRQASVLHVSTYLNQRRWEDDDWQVASKPKPQIDPLESAERNIKSGKRFLCTNIGTSVVSELLRTNRVTKEQCREVGL